MINPSHFTKVLFPNGHAMVENMVSSPYKGFWSTMADGTFSILGANSFTSLPGLPRPSQKGKRLSQYDIGVAFSRTMYSPFVLNNNLWAILYFLV